MAIQRRAASVGFDWPDAAGPRAKIAEELAELEAATDQAERTEELGDLLFAIVNYARHLEIEPNAALAVANAKFERRFAYVEKRLSEQGLRPADVDLERLDGWWDEAKRLEKSPSD
jgi:ATP diphosphatase